MNSMEEHFGDEDDEELLPSNPIERRDTKIAELEKNVAEMNVLQESVVKMKAELHIANKAANVARKKVKFARRVTEERLKECLPAASFEDDHSKVLITLMSTLIDEDSFEFDPETDTLKTKDDFLKDIEDSIGKDTEGELIKKRLEVVKDKLLDRVKTSSARNKERRFSVSSVSSLDRKRKNSTEILNDSKVTVRSKTPPIFNTQ